jgi:hypothetical protein
MKGRAQRHVHRGLLKKGPAEELFSNRINALAARNVLMHVLWAPSILMKTQENLLSASIAESVQDFARMNA